MLDCKQFGLGLYIDVLLVLLPECVCRLVQYSSAVSRAGELPGVDWLKDSIYPDRLGNDGTVYYLQR